MASLSYLKDFSVRKMYSDLDLETICFLFVEDFVLFVYGV